MAANYTTVFAPLGAELQNSRKIEAAFEQFHFTNVSTYSKRLVDSAYSSSDVNQDNAKTLAKNTYEQSVDPSLAGILSGLQTQFESGYFPVLDSQIGTSDNDKSAKPDSYAYDPSFTDGTISILQRTGRWGALNRQMSQDRQVILANALTVGSLVAAFGNLGNASLGSCFASDHTLSGSLNLICVDDTVNAPKFQVTNVLTNSLFDGTAKVAGDFQMTLGKPWQDGPTGITLQLNLGAVSVTGDPNSLFSSITITSPSEADTNKGKIYMTVARMGLSPIWRLLPCKDAALINGVGQTMLDGTSGTVAFQIICNGGTVINGTFSLTNANAVMPSSPGSYNTAVFDIRTPRINDTWTISLVNAEGANFATKIAHRYRASLNSAPAKPAAACTGALAGAGAGNVDNGTHSYVYTFVVNGVETGAAAKSNVVTVADKSTNGKVSLTGITAGPAGTTARKVYRTIAGDTGNWLLLTTIADNVTTVFTDNVADASLGTTFSPTQIDDTLATSISMT